MSVTTKNLCEILHQHPNSELSIKSCIDHIENVYARKISKKHLHTIKVKLQTLDKATQRALNKLTVKHRTITRALQHIPNGDGNFPIDDEMFEPIKLPIPSTSTEQFNDTDDHEVSVPKLIGRPKINEFSEMGDRLQRKFVQEAVKRVIETGPEASQVIAKKVMKLATDHVIDPITLNEQKKPQEISEENALALIIHQNLSVENYNAIRKIAKNHGANIFPSYYKVKILKKNLEPKNLIVTDKKATIPMKDLCENTSEGLIESEAKNINDILTHHNLDQVEFPLPASLICMWGMDGTTGQSIYNQADSEGNAVDDHSLFVASMTPLKLVVYDASNTEIILWENSRSGSYVWNRCISMEHAKETDAYTKNTYDSIQKEINELENHLIALNDTISFDVSYQFYLTMVDGKVAKVLSKTKSYQRCQCCLALPTEMNVLSNLLDGEFAITNQFPHTIGTLHTIINVVSMFYNIACRKEIKKWQVRGDKDKIQLRKNVAFYKERIFKATGVKYDEPRQGGSGTSSTGGACRKMLENPKKLAEVLELNEDFVCRVAVLLKVISCKTPINSKKFGEYCTEVYKRYIELYDWYYMPVTLHKLLAHGAEIIDSLPLSLGMMTEEGAESRNKYYRRYREFHARKTSREANMRDVMVRSQISSHPRIASKLIEKERKSTIDLPIEVRELLIEDLVQNHEDNHEQNLNDHNIFDFLEGFDEPFTNVDEEM